MATDPVCPRIDSDVASVWLRDRMRSRIGGGDMLILTALVTLLLFIYLLVALLRPEWF